MSQSLCDYFKKDIAIAFCLGEKSENQLARDALVKACEQLSLKLNLETLKFPHPLFSISHTQGIACAVSCRSSSGIGVDIEKLGRGVSEAVIKRISNAGDDFSYLENYEHKNLAIWVAKEACFKADLENTGKTLLDFAVRFNDKSSGSAFCGENFFKFYTWVDSNSGLLIALSLSSSKRLRAAE